MINSSVLPKKLILVHSDAVLEYFLEKAMEDFVIGNVDQSQWHPDYCSHRIAILVMVKKGDRRVQDTPMR